MSGWALSTTSTYLRHDTNGGVTAAPLTWLLSGVTSSLATQQCGGILCASGLTTQSWRHVINTDGTYSFTGSQGSHSPATTTNVVTANVPFCMIGRATSNVLREAILNGNFANKGTNTDDRIPAGVNRVSFGKKDDTADSLPWVGALFYSAFWTAVLTDDEVSALNNGAWPAKIRPSSLHFFWPNFGRNNGTTVNDWRGNAPLTITGGSVSTLAARRAGRRAA